MLEFLIVVGIFAWLAGDKVDEGVHAMFPDVGSNGRPYKYSHRKRWYRERRRERRKARKSGR